MLRLENPKNNIDLASDIVRCLGLLAKTNIDKDISIESIYTKCKLILMSYSYLITLLAFLPLLISLNKLGLAQLDGLGQNLLVNIVTYHILYMKSY